MKRIISIVIAVAMAACFSAVLAGCGGDSGGSQAPYESQKVTWSDDPKQYFELTTTKDEVVWDEEKGTDALFIYADIKNLQDKTANFRSIANIYPDQGGKSLEYVGSGDTGDAEILINSEKATALEPGESMQVVLAYYLENDKDVTVTFNAYTSSTKINDQEEFEVTYPVADRLSDGMKEVLAAQNAGSFTSEYFDVEVLDGWIISQSSTDSVSLDNDKTSAFVRVNTTSQSANKNAKRVADSFKKKVQTTTIGKTKWQIVTLNDSHFYLFADTSSGEKTVEVHAMATHKDSDKQIAAISIK